ncbi:MAG: aldehyde dehydrogenase family protein [Clostridiales bacterium]|nr:aldehyde dehydrogenase family protein [Clostridiales bacterium]
MENKELNYEGYMDDMIARARVAQAVARHYDQERVDELCEAVSFAAINDEFRKTAAQMLVDEAHMGRFEDKFAKIRSKAMGVYRDMKGEKSVGIIETNVEKNLVTYIKPMGVVGAILPVTNGEATPIVKSLWALKSRNAIIFSPGRAGKNTAMYVVNYIRKVLKRFDAPEDLVQCIEPDYVGREAAGFMMKKCDFIVATGGSGLVRSAYSSGTPTIGVGAGNATTYIDSTADLADAARKIRISQTFDYSTSCSSENNAVVDETVYDAFLDACRAEGAVVIHNGTPEKERLLKTLWPEWPENHKISRSVTARNISVFLKSAGIEAPENATFAIVEEEDGLGEGYPFTGEKLSPILTVVKAKNFEDGLDKIEKILEYSGSGHSCGIHTKDDKKIDIIAERMNVARVLVNQPQALGNAGAFFNGLPITMSLGCATWGGNSTCRNVTWRDITNTTTVSRPVEEIVPKEEELYSEKIRNTKF